ncbi:permease family-domain-containing protein [Radiomyces spectabilis]|uniref:permease family-domain-containing protein n=1 Tax=Radiomyces spectabilis TaxID=64574 RepID=UPI002220F968|nr:permease family-domain-containing protein [Radiomyces spectabilis]KAI8394011.1 permease family-domain-containing protein [Radiomyces spectabilis]
MGWLDKLNDRVAHSVIGKYFQLDNSGARRERKGTRFTKEIRAGCTIFFAMAYIISVNSSIISESGGTCVCNGTPEDPTCDKDEDYMQCIYQLKLDMIVATSIIAMIASVLIGTFANLPLGMAPGMGLNAYFTYTVVGYHGSGKVSYQTAVAAVFLEGCIFLLLSIFGIRQWLARVIPMSIKVAMGCGIGLYLCFIGLQSSAGIGLVTLDYSTLVTLGGCPPEALDEHGVCQWGHMESPTMYMGLLGLVVMALLVMYRVRGAILIAIVGIAITSWPRGNNKVTYFPYTPHGDAMFDYFKTVVNVHSIDRVVGKFDFTFDNKDIWIALVTLLYVDILDTTGTMYSMARYGGFTDKAGDFEHSTYAFMCDAVSVIIGSCFGSSPCTAFVESGAGIAEGGRTGITAITVAFGFFISIFFSPIFASFPPWSTGPALIVVGSMMTSSIRNINWDYPGDAVPAFITLAVMPFTYSIAYGIIGGIISYIVINGVVYIVDKASRGRIKPDYSTREDWWSTAMSRPFTPVWLRFVVARARGRNFDWHQDDMEFEDVPTSSAHVPDELHKLGDQDDANELTVITDAGSTEKQDPSH